MRLSSVKHLSIHNQGPNGHGHGGYVVASESILAYDGVISQSLRINGVDKRQFRPAVSLARGGSPETQLLRDGNKPSFQLAGLQR
jgi:hypothetical protein